MTQKTHPTVQILGLAFLMFFNCSLVTFLSILAPFLKILRLLKIDYFIFFKLYNFILDVKGLAHVPEAFIGANWRPNYHEKVTFHNTMYY